MVIRPNRYEMVASMIVNRCNSLGASRKTTEEAKSSPPCDSRMMTPPTFCYISYWNKQSENDGRLSKEDSQKKEMEDKIQGDGAKIEERGHCAPWLDEDVVHSLTRTRRQKTHLNINECTFGAKIEL